MRDPLTRADMAAKSTMFVLTISVDRYDKWEPISTFFFLLLPLFGISTNILCAWRKAGELRPTTDVSVLIQLPSQTPGPSHTAPSTTQACAKTTHRPSARAARPLP